MGWSSNLLLLTVLLPTTARADVGEEWGGLVVTLINTVGMRCGPASNIIERADPGWRCELVGPDNALRFAPACVEALNLSCVDVGGFDEDGDGFTIDDGDCDDGDDAVFPGALEVCGDGLDTDCDGAADDTSCSALLTDAGVKLLGETEDAFASISVCDVGDVDGDGDREIAIGAHGDDNTNGNAAGSVYLLTAETASALTGEVSLSEADVKILGERSRGLGIAVAAAGDVDGDGLADLLLTAEDDGSSNIAGMIYVVLGADLAGASGEVEVSDAYRAFIGEAVEDIAGEALSTAGDLDGDGLSELIIGSSRDFGTAYASGAAHLVYGASLAGLSSTASLADTDVKFLGLEVQSRAGGSVSGGGDVDGDGIADLLIGGEDPGLEVHAAFLLSGETAAAASGETSLSVADTMFRHEVDGYASNVNLEGDLNGDGFNDMIFGVFPFSGPGVVAVVLGSSSAFDEAEVDLGDADILFVGEENVDGVGFAVDSGGDVDGDGIHDLLIGAFGASDVEVSAGGGYLVYGGELPSGEYSLSEIEETFHGEVRQSNAGYTVSLTGDLDGDGGAEMLFGAPWDATIGRQAGAAYLVWSAGP